MTVKISHLLRMTVKRKYSAMAVRFWEKVESIARKRREKRLASFLESDYEAGISENVSFENPRKTDDSEQHATCKDTFLEQFSSGIGEQLDHPGKNYAELDNNSRTPDNVIEQPHSWSCSSKLNQQNLCYRDCCEVKNSNHPRTRPIAQNQNNLNNLELHPKQKIRTGVYIHPQDIQFMEELDSSQKNHRCTNERGNTFKDLDLKDLTDPQISSHSKDHPLLDVETYPVMFTWNKGGREVYLTGDFTRWKPVRMTGVEGAFVLTFHLPAGSYIYNFIVDDAMTHDERVRTVYLMKMKRNKVSVSREANEKTKCITDDWLWRRTYMGEAA